MELRTEARSATDSSEGKFTHWGNKMNIKPITEISERLAAIEKQHDVSFVFDYESNEIEAEGLEPDVQAALKELQPRHEFAEAIKARQPPPKVKRVRVRLRPEVAPKKYQREKYIGWFLNQPKYYQPSEIELERMMSAVQEGDEILPDFAHSFSVRKPDGRLVSVNRKGQVVVPSLYSPHLPKEAED